MPTIRTEGAVEALEWPNGPCEDMFVYFARHAPHRLVDFLRSGANPGLIARAIRVAAGVAFAVPALVELLDHPNHAVQESAIYALEGSLDAGLRQRLQQIAVDETRRPGVREAAREALE